MRISVEWLNDYVECADLSGADLADLMTNRIAEVDAIETVAAPVLGARVAYIKSVAAHPTREGLKLAAVSVGDAELEVVCGAPNCAAGMFSAFVPAGQSICAGPAGETLIVEAKSIGGVSSAGVLASEAELGLTLDHSGIIALNSDCPLSPGSPLAEAVGAADTVIVVDNKSLTHRPDLWSHYGFAREISAVLGRPLQIAGDLWADDDEQGAMLFRELSSGEPEFLIEIETGCGCRRFAGLEIAGVRPAQSPLWLRRRLFAVGAGVRNVLVDLSNYVMHDLGQPNHTYDADRLQGGVISARSARQGETLLCLDGTERSLTSADMVIADRAGPVALAGVMGGEPTSVCDSTKRLLLEAANFDPTLVRLMTKRHQLRTDASNRFEKSLSPFGVPLAIQRYAELLLSLNPGAHLHGRVIDTFIERPSPVKVLVSCEYIRDRLDPRLTDEQIRSVLTSLNFRLQEQGESLAVAVPYYRATRDISIAEDLVEEVGRIYGYDMIEETAPTIFSEAVRSEKLLEAEGRARDLLCAMGFAEVYNYSFMNGDEAACLGYETARAVRILNPIDVSTEFVRTTAVPGMIRLLAKNASHSDDVALFEVARSYEQLDRLPASDSKAAAGQYRESRLICIGAVAPREEQGVYGVSTPPVPDGYGFYSLAAAAKRTLAICSNGSVEISRLAPENCERDGAQCSSNQTPDFRQWMHPHRAALLSISGTVVGVVAEVRPEFSGGVNGRLIISEIDLAKALSADTREKAFQALPRFPYSFFEMSVVMPERTEFSELRSLLYSNVSDGLLKGLEVVAVYRGAPLNDGQKSVSVKLSLGAEDRTLSGVELTGIQEQLIKAVETSRFSLRT